MGGLIMKINKNVQFLPNILVKYVDNAPIDLDLNASFLFKERFWAGITYRWGDSVDAVFQIKVSEQLKIGAAYDFTLTELQDYNQGTLELMLEYNLNFKQDKIRNPRLFDF